MHESGFCSVAGGADGRAGARDSTAHHHDIKFAANPLNRARPYVSAQRRPLLMTERRTVLLPCAGSAGTSLAGCIARCDYAEQNGQALKKTSAVSRQNDLLEKGADQSNDIGAL